MVADMEADQAPTRRFEARARVDAMCYDAHDGTLVVASSQMETDLWTGGLEFLRVDGLEPTGRVALPCGAADACLVAMGLVAVAQDDGDVRIYDGTGELRQALGEHDAGCRCVAAPGDAFLVASGAADCTVKLWQLEREVSLATLEAHVDVVSAVAWVEGDRLLATASRDRRVRLWDTRRSGGPVASHALDHAATSLEASPGDGDKALFVGLQDGSVVSVDARAPNGRAPAAVAAFGAGAGVGALAVRQVGDAIRVAAGADDGGAKVAAIRAAPLALRPPRDLPARADYVRALAWLDDTTLAVGGWDGLVTLEDVRADDE